MKTQNLSDQEGFTLIETLMAMAIFTIGILGLFGMQTAAIKENLAANTITTGATWAADRIEWLLGQDYSNLVDKTGATAGCGGLDARTIATADGYDNSGTVQPIYHIYWNVANNCTMSTIPNATAVKQEQKPKHLRIIVTKSISSGEIEVARFNYIKQNTKKD